MSKQKIIIIAIVIILVLLLIIGIISFLNYGKESAQNNNSSGSSETVLDGGDEMINNYSSYEEVLEKIQNNYVDSNVTVNFTKEENDCWYFNDTAGDEYVYCINDPRIIKMEKDQAKK